MKENSRPTDVQYEVLRQQIRYAVWVFENPKLVTPEEMDRVLFNTPIEYSKLNLDELDGNKAQKINKSWKNYCIRQHQFVHSKYYKQRHALYQARIERYQEKKRNQE